MTTSIKIYRNTRNEHKFIEIHNDGYGHNSVKQFMYWNKDPITGNLIKKAIKNITGDQKLHRWNKANLQKLLRDYELINE